MSLGNRIKELRKVSQRQMAADLGITVTHLSHVENDRADPSLTLLRQIARYLKVNIGVTLGEETFSLLEEKCAHCDQIADRLINGVASCESCARPLKSEWDKIMDHLNNRWRIS